MSDMVGRRVEYSGSGPMPEPGAFWFAHGGWWGTSPNGLPANLKNHTVVEHEDGTITVTPSILINNIRRSDAATWHGFLTRGVWREC